MLSAVGSQVAQPGRSAGSDVGMGVIVADSARLPDRSQTAQMTGQGRFPMALVTSLIGGGHCNTEITGLTSVRYRRTAAICEGSGDIS